jgi:hypothetical protein
MSYGEHNRHEDPFGDVKIPSLSWKGLPIGASFTLEVIEPASLVQSRDYDSGEPAFWDAEKTQPKMCGVINVRVLKGPNSVGELRSVWAKKPSSLYAAIATAQTEAQARILPGGILTLVFSGETKHENKRFNAIKNYTAKYEAPAAPTAVGAFDDDEDGAMPDPTARQGKAGKVAKPGRSKPGVEDPDEDDIPY